MARRKRKKVPAKKPITSKKIECTFRKVAEFGSILPTWNSNEKKLGRYSGSYWAGVPKKRYAVLAYVDGEFDFYINDGLSAEEVAWACVNFLNVPPSRKKFARRSPKPLYGELDILRCTLKRDENNKSYFEMVITTEHARNKYFWGEGLEA